jgi:peroxin-2
LFQYEPELDAFLEFLIWRFSIWVDKPTPGNALMNLRYRDERAAPITGKEGILPYDFLSIVVTFIHDMFLEPIFGNHAD